MIVPRNLSVKEGHDLIDHLENDIKKELPRTVIVVHMEPCDANCERCKLNAPPGSSSSEAKYKECPDLRPRA
jgi:divalent metal cation (Fe/Co/Zn/Cd) transporter